MDRICLVTLVGLPAVGKTTFSKSLMELQTLPFNILHLCYDNYINFDFESPTQYKEQRENILKLLETIIKEFKNSKTLPCNIPDLESHYRDLTHNDLVIICDDNHYYHSMRYKLYQMARQFNIGYAQIYFECNEELALEHNNLRSGTAKIPEVIFLQMSRRLETPNMLSHTWEENTLILQQKNMKENNYLSKTLSYILKSLQVPLKSLEPKTKKSVTPQSIAHDLDLLMRKRINLLMNSSVKTNKNVQAKELNEKRKEILEEFQLNINQKLTNLKEKDLDLNKYVEMLQ